MSNEVQKKFAVIKALAEQELEEQKPAISIDDIPITYELISSQWLTNTVCRNIPGAEVVEHSLGEPDEGVTNRRKIFIKYNQAGENAGLPSKVFCKATQTPESRFLLGLNGGVEGEVNFYNKIRPLLDIETPEAIFSNCNPASLNSIILLKDMADEVEFCGHATKISRSHVESQMRVLAKLHGKYYESPELDTTLSSYMSMADFYTITEKAIAWNSVCDGGFLIAEDVIPARLFARAKEVSQVTPKAFMRHNELPRTFIHNDPHLKNWYIASSDSMGLSDWQTGVKGHWSRDLAYTLSTCLTVENRRAWETDLIKYYLDEFAKAGGDAISFEDTMLLYRQQMLSSLAMWTATIAPPKGGAEEMQPHDSCVEFIHRISSAVDDLDAVDSLL